MKKILCGILLGLLSLNVSADDTVLCYEKMECPVDGDINACKGIGKDAELWASAKRMGIGQKIKKGVYQFESATNYIPERHREYITGTCYYHSIALDTGARIVNTGPKWVDLHTHDPRQYRCHSTNPEDCAFRTY